MRVLSHAKPLPLPERVDLFHSMAHASYKMPPAGVGFRHSAASECAVKKVSDLQGNIPLQAGDVIIVPERGMLE